MTTNLKLFHRKPQAAKWIFMKLAMLFCMAVIFLLCFMLFGYAMPVIYRGKSLYCMWCVERWKRGRLKKKTALFTITGDMLFYHLTLKYGVCQFKLFLCWVIRTVCFLEKHFMTQCCRITILFKVTGMDLIIFKPFNFIIVMSAKNCSTSMIQRTTKIYLLSNCIRLQALGINNGL